MKILITNDDGINAGGLTTLRTIATELVEDPDDLYVVAPATEKSGVGHCISLASPVMITRLGHQIFSVEGNPADCVIAGVKHVLKESPPDLILSGVNRGNNSAENALYSGTLGAAMEGALQGIPSIALSQYLGPLNINSDNPFEAAETYGVEVIRKILSADISPDGPYRLFYNVNFPPCPASEVRGIKLTRQGYRSDGQFGIVPAISPSNREFLFIAGSNQHIQAPEGSDAAANLAGYISVTPMTADLTAYEVLDALRAIE